MLSNSKGYKIAFPGSKASELLPDGEYTVKVNTSEVKESAAGNNMYVANLQVMDSGKFKGRTVQFMSVWHVPIGLENLQDFLFAIGIEAVGDFQLQPEKYLNKVFKAKIGTREVSGKERNQVIAMTSAEEISEDEDDEVPVKKAKEVEETPKKTAIALPRKAVTVVEDDEEEETPPVKKKKVVIEEPEEDDDEEEAPRIKRRA